MESYKRNIIFNRFDENGPIGKLNKITARIGNSFNSYYPNALVKDVISTTIDSLDNDEKLHIGLISASGRYICLAQKYGTNGEYASGLVFGYSDSKLLYQRKYNGTWQTVREI